MKKLQVIDSTQYGEFTTNKGKYQSDFDTNGIDRILISLEDGEILQVLKDERNDNDEVTTFYVK